jgi:hypothetical protein
VCCEGWQLFLKSNKVNLFVSSVLVVFCYHSPNILDTPHTVYGAPCKAINFNVVYIYGPRFGNAEIRLFLFAANVSILNQCRKVTIITDGI